MAKEQKLINLAKAVKASLMLGDLGMDVPVDEARLSWTSIAFAGIFRAEAADLLLELENMEIISDFGVAEWPEYGKDSTGKEKKRIVEGFTMEVNTNQLNVFVGTKEPTTIPEEATPPKKQISLITEKGIGYLKFYKQGPRIEIGNTKTRKFRLLNALIDPLGTAKTIKAVFESIELPKDKKDGRIADNYLLQERAIELIEYTMKELQKIEGLTGKIKLGYANNRRSVWLILEP